MPRVPLTEPACKICGCTNNDCLGCTIVTGQPCCWEPTTDGTHLCSACTGLSGWLRKAYKNDVALGITERVGWISLEAVVLAGYEHELDWLLRTAEDDPDHGELLIDRTGVDIECDADGNEFVCLRFASFGLIGYDPLA